MIKDKQVYVQIASASYTSEAMPSLVWTANQSLKMVNIQPLSGEMAYKDYGISEAGITKLMFCDVDSVFQKGRRIVHGSNTYAIYSVEEFPTHYECPLKPI